MKYRVNVNFRIDKGFLVVAANVNTAVKLTNGVLEKLPSSLFLSIDYKTTSALVGSIVCQNLADEIEGAIVNPIEKGHPDIIPEKGRNASEAQLRNYPLGLEIKSPVGNVKQGSRLRPGENRLGQLSGLTWQAHHREVAELLGLVWDFENFHNGFKYPTITGVFYTHEMTKDDWGAISGTRGRNTKVCGIKASGRKKMGKGWVLIHEKYRQKYLQLLGVEG